jgi:hypothetical protein
LDHPFVIADGECGRLGLIAGAVCLPTPERGVFVILGMAHDGSRLLVLPCGYRRQGDRLVATATKTLNLVGPFNGIDIDLPSLRIYREKMLQAGLDAVKTVGPMLDEFRRGCAGMIGGDLIAARTMPGEMRVINRALELRSVGKIDQARLVLQWPWLFNAFDSFPKILDKAAAGVSLFELIPDDFGGESVKELKKLKKFSPTWVEGGVPTASYIPQIVKACAFLPEGGQRPENKHEANTVIAVCRFADTTFASLSQEGRDKVKKLFLAKSECWKGATTTIRMGFAHDYVEYVYRNLVLDALRHNGMVGASEDRRIDAFMAVVGSNVQKIAEASRGWHRQQRDAQVRRDRTIADKWVPAFETVLVPKFKTIDGTTHENVHIVPLDTDEALASEGMAQHHCVYTQKRSCAEGHLRIASVRVKTEDGFSTLSTVSFFLSGGQIVVREHRGNSNVDPGDAAREAIGWFEDNVNRSDPPFKVNRNWTPAHPDNAGAGRGQGLRAELHERFQQCKSVLSKKMQKGGFEAFLKECS